MKHLLSLVALLFFLIGYSQTELAGVWITKDQDKDAPKVIEFKSDGAFVIFEYDAQQKQEVVEGSYYYEDGKDLLVTITWYGSQAKTTKYKYELINGKLELSQIYPNKAHWTFEREVALSEQF